MTTLVIKDGIVMGCQNEVQLAAFLSSGWAVYEEPVTKAEEPEQPVKKAKRTATKR